MAPPQLHLSVTVQNLRNEKVPKPVHTQHSSQVLSLPHPFMPPNFLFVNLTHLISILLPLVSLKRGTKSFLVTYLLKNTARRKRKKTKITKKAPREKEAKPVCVLGAWPEWQGWEWGVALTSQRPGSF